MRSQRFEFKDGDETGNVHFHYNGDFSGDVDITVDTNVRQVKVSLPMIVVRSIVAAQIRSQKISNLEKSSDDQILGVFEDET